MAAKKDNPYRKKLSRRELFMSLTGRGKRKDAVEDTAAAGSAIADADTFFKRARYAEAAVSYRRFLAKHPDHMPVKRRLALSLYHASNLDGAAAVLEEMLAAKNTDSFARLYLGLVRARQGDGQGALTLWSGYFNIDQPLIQREINLLIARQEIGEQAAPEELVRDVETAIASQQKADGAG